MTGLTLLKSPIGLTRLSFSEKRNLATLSWNEQRMYLMVRNLFHRRMAPPELVRNIEKGKPVRNLPAARESLAKLST